MMVPKTNINTAIGDALKKAQIAWETARYKIKKYTRADMQLKIILLNALVGSVLLYSLHLCPLTQTQAKRIQTFLFKMHQIPHTRTLYYHNAETYHE